MKRFVIEIDTEGNGDIVNLSPELSKRLGSFKEDGVVNIFIVGSTAALTTLEYEPGLVQHDLPRVLQQIAPDNAHYDHEATWNDDNGHAHVRAALIGPSLTVPIAAGKLLTGEYQQVVLLDFDTRPRKRKIICTILT